jgi:hypothetical protein
MFYREIFSVFTELYLKGGIEVCTFSESNVTRHGKDDSSLLIRTIIQPDGDVMTFLSERALREASFWEAHLDQIGDKIRKLRLLRIVPEMLVSLISSFLLLFTGIWHQWDRAIITTALLCGAVVLVTPRANIIAEGMKEGFQRDAVALIGRVFYGIGVPGYLFGVVSVGILFYKRMILIGLLVPLVFLVLKLAVRLLLRSYLRFKAS